MNTIRIQNLRSLVDTKSIVQKKLTILLGKNSVGKSTYLRFFTLMKQSLGANRVEPIVWYAKNLVDFGSFDTSITSLPSEQKPFENMTFSFGFKIPSDMGRRFIFRKKMKMKQEDILFEISFDNKNDLYIKIRLLSFCIKIYFKNDSNGKGGLRIEVNDFEIEDYYSYADEFRLGEIIPRLHMNFDQEKDIFRSYILEIKNRRLSDRALEEICDDLESELLNYDEFRKKFLEVLDNHKALKEKFMSFENDKRDKYVKKLYNICGVQMIPGIVNYINGYLAAYFENVQYIGPVRATAERYYRQQNLSVDNIMADGENVPDILASMKKAQQKKFQDWTKKNFSVCFSVVKKENNNSIIVEEYENGRITEKNNITDTGFGYSQILPILVYIWRQRNPDQGQKFNRRFSNNLEITLLIEQPELHLHPEMQVKEMNAIDKMISMSTEQDLRIVLETHSEYLVKQLGHDIANGVIDYKDVDVLFFDQDSKTKKTSITNCELNENGYFNNWPIGFFKPKYK